jgi:hypothetical protein
MSAINSQQHDVQQRGGEQHDKECDGAEELAEHDIGFFHWRGHECFDGSAGPFLRKQAHAEDGDDADENPDHPVEQMPHFHGLSGHEIVPKRRSTCQQK